MFYAMNRFIVLSEQAAAFEARWREREVHISTLPGFVVFNLLRGPEKEGGVLYVSHTLWRTRADFEAWTKSEAFRAAHRDAGSGTRLTTGHPVFEGFDSVLETVPA
ncbi:antibiotic biosynthesis monooxygenase family protein [Rhodopila sp.]|jgi:heme-degrading monooxygenase HmoA|uniref:antibiotic biosynthesis monooxygenase family protein n=1 Tax=Rhodopila sp. TaxID=2480087 RepID=UPI002C14CA5C|nr:antibiotic biosynthesis monooxygenase [Rhodopila sp.]HVZ08062.1 antibiotic biosynthesis monooxygenase [Rhodopila sp.]